MKPLTNTKALFCFFSILFFFARRLWQKFHIIMVVGNTYTSIPYRMDFDYGHVNQKIIKEKHLDTTLPTRYESPLRYKNV